MMDLQWSFPVGPVELSCDVMYWSPLPLHTQSAKTSVNNMAALPAPSSECFLLLSPTLPSLVPSPQPPPGEKRWGLDTLSWLTFLWSLTFLGALVFAGRSRSEVGGVCRVQIHQC